MYEIRSAGAKGLGVFAKSFIPRGTRIFSERPLLGILPGQGADDIFVASKLLSKDDWKRLTQLSTHVTKELSVLRWSQAVWYTIRQFSSQVFRRRRAGDFWTLPRAKEHVMVLSIFRNNAFNLGARSPFQQAVFPKISRLNHSCVPNAQGNFHEGLGRFNVHTTHDIEPDEEITLNYLEEHGAAREMRQDRLLNGYGFTCECPACDVTSARGRDGEERRALLYKHLSAFVEGTAKTGVKSAEKELQTIGAFIRLLEGEGIAGRELSALYLEAAKLNVMLGNPGEALLNARRGLEIEAYCLGSDHPAYQESLKVVEELKSGIQLD